MLKAPKTPTSIRKVFLPKTVAEMLVAWKMEQDAAIEAIGNEYADFNLVIATPVGLPCESAQIRKALKNLIEKKQSAAGRLPQPSALQYHLQAQAEPGRHQVRTG